MWAAGSPCTYWRNSSVTKIGALPTGLTKCYCWSTPSSGDVQTVSPDRKHFLCQGTGYLEGYQKYGYTEITLSTPSTLTKSSQNIIVRGERGSSYSISGNSLVETLTSEKFTLTNFKEFSHFLVNDKTDPDQNRIEYEYTINEVDWITIELLNYSEKQIANRYGILDLPSDCESIRFRIRLRKKVATSQSPMWNSIRFRYRKQISLRSMDPRFAIDIPAFMAAREQQTKQIEQGQYGWTTKFPIEWWTLPDADILNTDIIMFLQGTYKDYRFQVKNLRELVYGENLQLLHKKFESVLIRDENELLGIVHYLL